MADPADVEATKYLRREFNRRQIDVTQADLRVMHHVAYIRGSLKSYKGGPPDLRKECENIAGYLKQTGRVKDVVIDCSFRA